MISVAIVIALMVQGQTAEETLKAIESNVLNAKTLKIKCVIRAIEGEPNQVSGQVFLSGENKAKAELLMPRADLLNKVVIVSDGKRVSSNGINAPASYKCPLEVDVPIGFRDDFAVGFVRGGLLFAISAQALMLAGRKPLNPGEHNEQTSFKTMLKVINARFEVDEGKNKVIVYSLDCTHLADCEFKVYFEPESKKILKRTICHKKKDSLGVDSVEIFEDFEINGELPKEVFELRGISK